MNWKLWAFLAYVAVVTVAWLFVHGATKGRDDRG